MAEQKQFILPTGRIVQGAPSFVSDKDPYGNKKKTPNFFMAVAIPKTDPAIGPIMQELFALAMAGYQNKPHVQQQIGQYLNGKFAWKIKDGDDKANAGKEGFPGCFIFNLSTTFPIQCFKPLQNGTFEIIPTESVKTGYFVDVNISASINELDGDQAGIYLNPRGVVLVSYGEIISNMTPEQMFAGHQSTARPGMLATPPANAVPATAQGGFAGQPPQQQMPPMQQQGGFVQQPQQAGFAGQPPQQQGFAQQPPQQMQQQPGFTTPPPQAGQPVQGFQQQTQPQGFAQQPVQGAALQQQTAIPAGATQVAGYQGIAFPSN